MQSLTGDIGGTKTRLAVVEIFGNVVNVLRETTYASKEFAQFDELLAQFLKQGETPDYAAFGVAGPVQGRMVHTTNLPWMINADDLMQRFGFKQCYLLNDLEATAYGIAALNKNDFCELQAGYSRAMGNAAVIAAGTGLGEAGLFWDGARYYPFATEGGHASFAPSNALEMALLAFLQQRYSHVSWERVVSGMGLVDIHQFLHQHYHATVPEWFAQSIYNNDAAATIAEAAMTERDELCVKTMELFVQFYAAEAGNLALKMMSRGGLFIGGGIAPKILPLLENGKFIEAFLHKGRMRPLLEGMPVKVILNDRTALFGPALYAQQVTHG